jgi:hypothetical protein
LSSGGDPRSKFGLAGEIDLGSHGNIYVADAKEMSVLAHKAAGQFVSRFGTVGAVPGNLSH